MIELKMKKQISLITPILLAAGIVLISFIVLFFHGGMGLSDNGDYGRVIKPNYISFQNEQDRNYVFNKYYTMDIKGHNAFEKVLSLFYIDKNNLSYISPHFFIVQIAKCTNFLKNIISGETIGQFNIFHLGIIYVIIYIFDVFNFGIFAKALESTKLFCCIVFPHYLLRSRLPFVFQLILW